MSGKWTRVTIIREYKDPKPDSLFKPERRNAIARNPKKVQEVMTRDNEQRREDMREEHAPHLDTRNNGHNLDSRPTLTLINISPITWVTSFHVAYCEPHISLLEPSPNSKIDQILLLTKDNEQKSPFSLQELNAISDSSWYAVGSES